MRGPQPVVAPPAWTGPADGPEPVGHGETDAPGAAAAMLRVLRAALDGFPGGFAVLQAVRRRGRIVDWTLVEVNSLVARRFAALGPVVGRPVSQLDELADNSGLMVHYAAAVETGQIQVVDVPLHMPDGWSWRTISIVPVGDDMVASFTRDSTAEHDLEAERARSAGILDNTSAMVMILDRQGVPLAERRGNRFLGWSDEELEDRSRVLLCDEDRETLESWFVSIAQSRPDTGHEPLIMRMRARDGSVRICRLTASNRLDDPHIAGVIVSVEDATSLLQAEARAAALAENVTDIVVILDETGTLVWVSPALKRVLGDDPDDHLGRDALDIVHPDDRAEVVTQLARALADDRYEATLELRITDAEHNWRWFECRGVNRLGDPALRGIVVSLHDISERRQAEAALRASEARSRAVLETAADAIVTIDDRGRIEGFNRAAETIFRVDAPTVLGRDVGTLLRPGSRNVLRAGTGTAGEPGSFEVVARRADGELFPAEVSTSVAIVDDRALVTAIIRDVTEQKAIERRLELLALHDELTGLPNRRLLVDRIDAAITRARRHRSSLGVMFLDLDRFKVVNDSLGHDAGDQLLVLVADRIRAEIRDNDTVSRLGGDEFVVLCEDLNGAADASELAGRLVATLAEPFVVGRDELFVTTSIGIALWDGGDSTAVDLLRFADTAMYRAKELGRARVELFDATMRSWVDARVELEAALRHAVARDELSVHYQPIVSLADGHVTHAEALLRWRRHDGTMVPPAEVVRMAEENGLIGAIGEWVLRRAASDAAAWQGSHPGAGVSVNVSARQLSTGDLRALVTEVLRDTGLPPALLTLEITESVLLDDTDRTLGTLEALHDLGLRIALDDFGTGFSSLTYLRRLPIDELKIDHSFVEAAENGRRDVTMLRTIVDLGHAYHLDVVAEGVDSERKAATLRTIGCPYAQGFLYGRPGPLGKEGPAWG